MKWPLLSLWSVANLNYFMVEGNGVSWKLFNMDPDSRRFLGNYLDQGFYCSVSQRENQSKAFLLHQLLIVRSALVFLVVDELLTLCIESSQIERKEDLPGKPYLKRKGALCPISLKGPYIPVADGDRRAAAMWRATDTFTPSKHNLRPMLLWEGFPNLCLDSDTLWL